ncbi:MAG: hypothetical protein WC520_01360 [Candidatus Paceibacterota bacterium]
MDKHEIAKFFSGFFAAGVLMHLFAVLMGKIPFTVFGISYDFKFWTLSFAAFFVLSVLFAFFGWGLKGGKKYASASMVVLSLIAYFIGFELLSSKNINILQASLSSSYSQSIIDGQTNNTGNVGVENLNTLFTFNLGSEKFDGGKVIDTDTEGNIYTAGYFQGTINLNQSGGLKEVISEGNSLISSAMDIYVAKYSSDKKIIWGFSIGSVGKDIPLAIKVDGEGNVYLAGYFGGLAGFDPDNKANTLDAGTGRDAFLAKYDKDGNFRWAKKIGNPEKIPFSDYDFRFEEVRDIAIDAYNNVYVAGVFDGTVNLNEPNEQTPENTFTSNSGSRDIFIAKYDAYGQYLKGTIIGASSTDEVQGIRVGTDGNIYITGYFSNKTDFNAKNQKNKTAIVLSSGGTDAFLAKYDKEFNSLWVRKWGNESDDEVAAMEIDENDNIFVAGNFYGNVSISGKALAGRGESDVFFAKFMKDGQLAFAKSFGGENNDFASKVKLDKEGNIYIAGSFETMCDFNTAKPAQSLISISNGDASDAYIAKYSPTGDYAWARDIGGEASLGEEYQSAEGVAVDNNNNPIITGMFYYKIAFHSTESLDLLSRGLSDGFVVKYNDNGEIE